MAGLRLAGILGLAIVAVSGCAAAVATAPSQRTSSQAVSTGSCPARPSAAAITLNDRSPGPAVAVAVGAALVVTVPPWRAGQATVVHVARSGILREECTDLLSGGGRRTIFLAVRPGSTQLDATVEPATDLEMPAWGGSVVVRSG